MSCSGVRNLAQAGLCSSSALQNTDTARSSTLAFLSCHGAGRGGRQGKHPVPGLPSSQVLWQEFAAGTLAGFEVHMPDVLSPSMACTAESHAPQKFCIIVCVVKDGPVIGPQEGKKRMRSRGKGQKGGRVDGVIKGLC